MILFTDVRFIRRAGTPEGTRTPGLLLRRQLLYPTELLAQMEVEQVTRIELASPAWKAGALTIVLHLRLPSVEIVSLDILTYIGMHVKQFSYNFLQFFHKLSGFFHFPLPATPIQKPIEQNSAILHTVSGKFFSHPLWMPLDRPDR